MEFFRTPNGSFWDPDDEYFNRNGFDIHGGYYLQDMEYIPGPTWLSDLGCYEDDKEMYENIDLEKMDDNLFYGKEEENYDDIEFKGDFEEEADFNDQEYKDFLKNGNYNDILKNLDINNLNMGNNQNIDDILKSLGNININEAKPKKSKGKKKKKGAANKKKNEEEDWETASDN